MASVQSASSTDLTARLNQILAASQTSATPGAADIVWRSRAAATPALLVKLVTAPGITADQRDHYMRAFDFLSGKEKQAALEQLALAQLDAERQAGYAECNRIIGDAEDTLLRLPGSTPSYAATVRATRSLPPPGGKGTMMRMGLLGNACADTAPETSSEHAAATNRMHTGRPISGTVIYPSFGSVIAGGREQPTGPEHVFCLYSATKAIADDTASSTAFSSSDMDARGSAGTPPAPPPPRGQA